jgi:hypothetical protein
VVASRALDTVCARDADLASTRDRSTLSLDVTGGRARLGVNVIAGSGAVWLSHTGLIRTYRTFALS